MTHKSEWAVSRSGRIGKRHRVTITGGPGRFVVEWDPVPEPHSLTGKEVAAYKRLRNAVVADINAAGHGPLIVLDL
jgi:hypothetical protein